MSRKPKFNPEITRVKLNPEQAVLACSCWDSNQQGRPTPASVTAQYCVADMRAKTGFCSARGSAAIS